MFRITKIFANGSVEIYKIEGKVMDDSLQVWGEELLALHQYANRHILLDFSQVCAISANAVKALVTHLASGILVMNPSIEVRNILHAAGLSARVLE